MEYSSASRIRRNGQLTGKAMRGMRMRMRKRKRKRMRNRADHYGVFFSVKNKKKWTAYR